MIYCYCVYENSRLYIYIGLHFLITLIVMLPRYCCWRCFNDNGERTGDNVSYSFVQCHCARGSIMLKPLLSPTLSVTPIALCGGKSWRWRMEWTGVIEAWRITYVFSSSTESCQAAYPDDAHVFTLIAPLLAGFLGRVLCSTLSCIVLPIRFVYRI